LMYFFLEVKSSTTRHARFPFCHSLHLFQFNGEVSVSGYMHASYSHVTQAS